MDAFVLAMQFKEFVARAWPGNAEDSRDLLEFFADWAMDREEGDLIAQTAGSYTMALQTWIVVMAWFTQRPDDFTAIRGHITVPLELPADATRLPDILDEGEWNRRVFVRKHPERR